MAELDPPGAGLPGFEKLTLNAMFRLGCAFTSDRRALKSFQTESDRILEFVEHAVEGEDLFEQTLIPRQAGMEDSSRNWSLMMVLDHLCSVNSDIVKIINALKRNIEPRGIIDTADYKPDPDVGFDVIERFRTVNLNLETEVSSHRTLRTTAKMTHPWFGQLDAHGWNFLASVHQRIHRKQAQKIVALLGVV